MSGTVIVAGWQQCPLVAWRLICLLCCSVCDLKKRKVIQTLRCHSGAVSACCIDSAGGQLMTACESEGTTLFWDVSQLLRRVLHSEISLITTTQTLTRKSAPLEDLQVLTECDNPTEDFGPIPSSFSPSATHKRCAASPKETIPTASSLPVWRTKSDRQNSLWCEERVRRGAIDEESEGMSAPLPLGTHTGTLSMSAFRTSVCRQELQRRRAQEHASWLRNNLNDLDAMQHELRVCPIP
jgi:WD40 repeat protein